MSPTLAGGFLSTGPPGKSHSPELEQVSLKSSPLAIGESEGRSVMPNSVQPRGLYSPWNSPGQNTAVGSLSLLQGIFPTQGSNPGLLDCRLIPYQLSHKLPYLSTSMLVIRKEDIAISNTNSTWNHLPW